MKNLMIVLTVLLALFAALITPGFGDQKKAAEPKIKTDEQGKASIWMEAKLGYSQKILASLSKGDLGSVSKNAENMNFMGYLEKWAKAETPAYKQQMSLFQFANEELVRQAKAKNLEGATLAFNQLTVSCVQCHKLIRK